MLLETDSYSIGELRLRLSVHYKDLKKPMSAYLRDLGGLQLLGTIEVERLPVDRINLKLILDWPARITEKAFFERLKELPQAKGLPLP